jgi:hypothetical protein
MKRRVAGILGFGLAAWVLTSAASSQALVPNRMEAVQSGEPTFRSAVLSAISPTIPSIIPSIVPPVAPLSDSNTSSESPDLAQSLSADPSLLHSYGIGNENLWVLLFATLLSGGFGGFVYHLMNYREIRKVLREEEQQEGKKAHFRALLSCASHVSIGAASAPPIVLLLRPESAFALLVVSVLAGLMGSAIVRNIQDKLLATVAKAEARENTAIAQRRMTEEMALRFNQRQADLIGRLIQTVRKPVPDADDWAAVRRLTKELAETCHQCSKTLGDADDMSSNLMESQLLVPPAQSHTHSNSHKPSFAGTHRVDGDRNG